MHTETSDTRHRVKGTVVLKSSCPDLMLIRLDEKVCACPCCSSGGVTDISARDHRREESNKRTGNSHISLCHLHSPADVWFVMKQGSCNSSYQFTCRSRIWRQPFWKQCYILASRTCCWARAHRWGDRVICSNWHSTHYEVRSGRTHMSSNGVTHKSSGYMSLSCRAMVATSL